MVSGVLLHLLYMAGSPGGAELPPWPIFSLEIFEAERRTCIEWTLNSGCAMSIALLCPVIVCSINFVAHVTKI